MILALQPHIMERTVFEAVRRDVSIESHYQRRFAHCYDEQDADKRERAFQQLHESWFTELGLKERILKVVREFEHFCAHVNRLAVTHAPALRAHAVELFGAPGRYTVAMAVTPAFLLDDGPFSYWARHEFMHVDDMLDPAFAFEKGDLASGNSRAAKNLFQDRYAVLWAVSIDARLAQRGQLPVGVRDRRLSEFIRAFALDDVVDRESHFESTWAEWRDFRSSHSILAEWAREGPPSVRAIGHNCDGSAPRMAVGGTCPLCNFSTFVWGSALDAAEIVEAVKLDFPNWAPSLGICARCVEVYRAIACAK